MWVNPDIKSQQWTTVTSRKSKGKARAFSSNVVSIFTRETEKDVVFLTSLGVKESTFTADKDIPLTSKTRPGKQYLKQYGEPMINSPQPAKETNEQSTKPSMEKQKELWYVKALQKNGRGASTPFRFDVLAQLANIYARTLSMSS